MTRVHHADLGDIEKIVARNEYERPPDGGRVSDVQVSDWRVYVTLADVSEPYPPAAVKPS